MCVHGTTERAVKAAGGGDRKRKRKIKKSGGRELTGGVATGKVSSRDRSGVQVG